MKKTKKKAIKVTLVCMNCGRTLTVDCINGKYKEVICCGEPMKVKK
jgi:hypothetical protein